MPATIEDYGLEGCRIVDYRVALVPEEVEAIVSNPPFAWAIEFLERALSQVPYVGFLLRTHFLIEGSGRDLPRRTPGDAGLSRLAAAAAHAPHRLDRRQDQQSDAILMVRVGSPGEHSELPQRFNWRTIMTEYEAGRLDLGPQRLLRHQSEPDGGPRSSLLR